MVSTWKKEGATVASHEPKYPIRSSAAEYLTFVAATGDGAESMEMRYEDENICMENLKYDMNVITNPPQITLSAVNTQLLNADPTKRP